MQIAELTECHLGPISHELTEDVEGAGVGNQAKFVLWSLWVQLLQQPFLLRTTRQSWQLHFLVVFQVAQPTCSCCALVTHVLASLLTNLHSQKRGREDEGTKDTIDGTWSLGGFVDSRDAAEYGRSCCAR